MMGRGSPSSTSGKTGMWCFDSVVGWANADFITLL